MIRWIRNIFIAVVITIAIFWVFAAIVGIGLLTELLFPVLIILLLLAAISATVIVALWAVGLTRFSNTRVIERSIIILTYIEHAVRLNLPLPQMLIAAEASEPRWIGNRIGKLRRQLDGGSSIADALRKTVPGTSRRSLALIGAAERMGRVGPELGYLVRQERNRDYGNAAERSFLRIYPVAMICVIVGILSMLMIFVVPKFRSIFSDFCCPLPPLTLAVIHFANLPFDSLWFMPSIMIVVVAVIAQQIRHSLDWGGPARWFTSNRDLADICRVIGESMAAGLPLGAAIRSATELSISGSMRRKLERWADGIERGMNSVDAANIAGLPRLIAGLSVTAEGFEFLSRYYAGKFSRLMTLLRGAAVPAMVFFFGVIVAIVALTMFLPLVALIDSTAGQVNAL